MRKLGIHIIASLTVIAFFASCSGIDKMKKNAPTVSYTVKPTVLETHAGNVDVAIDVKFPEKYFDKKVQIEATPVLVYEGGETAFPSKKYQGESVQGNDKAISYLNGGTDSYKGSAPYNDKMRVADLVIRIKGTKGEKSQMFDDIKIAQGVNATSTLIRDQDAMAAYAKDNFQRIIPTSKEAEILFMISQAAVRGTELKKEEIAAIKAFVAEAQAAENINLKGVAVSAYASPDGKVDFNTKLASKREGSTQDYLKKEFKKDKVTEAEGEGFYALKNTPEDWDGFKALMEASTIQDKELILRVLSMYTDPEVREKEIKNMSATYKTIAKDILPKLRRSKIAVNAELVGKSDEQILELAQSNPASLNVEEILYAGTLTSDIAKKEAIYSAAYSQFATDFRATNNYAAALINQGKLDQAAPVIAKANELKANEPVVQNNLGAIALKQGDYKKAEELFGAAAGVGAELDNNLGIIALHKADYENAVKYFGASTECNAALAKILAGKAEAALATLNANTVETGFKYYLKAICGVRMAENDQMFSSLTKAGELDAAWKTYAKKDMEFVKFFEDAAFKAAIQ